MVSALTASSTALGSLAQLLNQEFCLLLMSEDSPDLINRSKNAFEVVRICYENCDVLVLKLLCEHFEL